MLHYSTFMAIIMLIFTLLPITAMILWLLALSSVLKSNFKSSNAKTKWIIIIVVLPVLGALLYFLIGKRQIITKNISSGS